MSEESAISNPNVKAMQRWKKILLIVLTVIVSVFVLAFLAAWVAEDRIKAMIVSEINNQVAVPVKLDGGIKLSFIKHFPYASVTFEKVSIDDKIRKGSKKLLKVEEVSFLCNIYSLFGNDIEFSKIVIRNGELNLYTNEAGKSNFDILKPQKENSKNELSVQLKNVQIKGVKFTCLDKTQATDIDLKLKDVQLKGNFKDKNFDLESTGKIYVSRIFASGEEFLVDKNIAADITLNVDKLKQRYNFKKGNIVVEETAFSITGFFVSLKDKTQVDFKLLNAGKDIQQLFSLFPQKYRRNFAGAEGSGEYSIVADVRGVIGRFSLPKVNVDFDLKDSELKFGAYNKLLKNVNATARYESDENGNDKIIISNFNCTLNDLPFNFKLSLTKLSDPEFDFFANGVLHLGELSSFLPDSVVQDIGGTITFNNFHLKGRKNDFIDAENSTLVGSGDFKLSEVEFRQNGVTYGNINGLLKYENRIIKAQNFTLNFLSTDFDFTGSIANLFPFVYNLSEKRKANEVVLGINGKIKTQTFNLTGILEAYNKKSRPTQQQIDKINIREIFSMKGNIEVEIGKFLFRKMKFDDLKTNLQIAPGIVQVNHLSTSAMAGELRSTGLISFTADNALNLKMDVSAVGLNIAQIFNQCEDFGQSVLTGKNLKGTMTASIAFDATWKNYKEFDPETFSSIVDFKITNGELIKFEPLRAASKFIRIEELEDIRFSDLENTMKIANSRIDIPEFEIKTSALNLMFFGHHTFNNDVDYHFKINLHKLLAQKFNRRQQDIQYIENDPYEGVNLYLTMTGNLNNPKIKFDKSSSRNKIQADFRNEKTVLRDLLKNTTKKIDEQEQRREDKYFNVKEDPQFMDFDTSSN